MNASRKKSPARSKRTRPRPSPTFTAPSVTTALSERVRPKQQRVAIIDTRCRGCVVFTLHAVTKVSFSQFGAGEHHVLTCQECGNERRLETITDAPTGSCWGCAEAAVPGEVLCATCKLEGQQKRNKR